METQFDHSCPLSLQAMFTGVNTLDVLRTDPSVLLHPTRFLQDRVQFLQKLGSTAVALADIQHSVRDQTFALQAVRAHLQASGKSLLQLSTELQGQPGGREYMVANRMHPSSMTALQCFMVATGQAKPAPQAADGIIASTGELQFFVASISLFRCFQTFS